ncbi:DNA-binding transcriptional regulator, MerR family [Streptomyces sp. yr375]|uniref:MerR family transcriptional regulator n=1 Tax=Streptomyces sp. yr375 TaxID=1761906 RepID=UPI0008C62B9F|nr:MerR family transcriptional regulator [Streptomyces sp. yr375]SES40186.1 DNA-binding transcriptional regulator, MerR family [Streptomyces sp. yr375]
MTDRPLRTVDLARLAGLSTQQIRNYEEAGVLPPAGRTASGYRTFTDVHRQALLTHRALLPGYGPVAAARIMRTLHAGDVPAALALVDAAHAALHEERTALRATGEALTALTAPTGEAAPAQADSGLRIGDLAALLGVRTSALRVWEAAGLLAPPRERATGYRVFGPAEVRDARVIQSLRRSHYLFAQIRPVLAELRRAGGSEAALRTALADRARTLTSRTRAMLAGAGRLHDYLDRVAEPEVSAAGTTTGSTAGGPGPSAR